MDCQLCGEPATVHLTDIVNKKKRQMHLCEGCARKQNLITDDPTPQLNLQPVLQISMGQLSLLPVDTGGLLCPTCGLKYAQFRATGRLGCGDDYDAFRPALEPLLERIHRGLKHAGKVPVAERARAARALVAGLKDDLAAAVATERYEDAARLRDRIKTLERTE